MDDQAAVASASVFKSTRHPENRPYPLVFSQNLSDPLGILFLPLMILTLIAALQHAPVIDYLLWGFPTATAVAFLWTAFKLRREIAEVRVRGQSVAIRSVHDVSADRRGRRVRWLPLFDVRSYGRWLVAAAGDADYVFHDSEWPQYDQLHAALDAAAYPRVAG